jgi:predicted nucleotidyltransferase
MDTEQLKNELTPIFAKYQGEIVAAYLFGSMAKGEPSPSSDIDIAILMRGNIEKNNGAALKFCLYPDLCRKLKRNDIDLVLLSLSGNLILNDEIVRYGKVIFSTDDDARERYELNVLHRATDFKFQRYYALGV